MGQVVDLDRCVWVFLHGFVEVDSVDRQDGSTAELYAWCRDIGGALLLWRFDPRKAPGCMQTWAVIPEA